MKSSLTLGQFRTEIGKYSEFLFSTDDPLSPLGISCKFESVVVNLSASPYIALKKDADVICISHIQNVRKRTNKEGEREYILFCNDFQISDEPTLVKYSLKCV